MRISVYCRPLAIGCMLAITAGCGVGSQPSAPLAGAAQQVTVLPKTSIVLPPSSTDLLYVSYYRSRMVKIYSYPKGEVIGTIETPWTPHGMCADTNGHVWITTSGKVVEYAHGGTSPLIMLDDGKRPAWACSWDATTGNLAVVNLRGQKTLVGDVMIYQGAHGVGKRYRDKNIEEYYGCGYDGSGNLFVTGYDRTAHKMVLTELPAGATKFQDINLLNDVIPHAYNDVQWDGENMVVSSPAENRLLRLKFTGTVGLTVRETKLYRMNGVAQFSIWSAHGQGRRKVLGASIDNGNALMWRYPEGGSPLRRLSGGNFGSKALGSTLSLGPGQ